MGTAIDYKGRRFGKLTALEPAGYSINRIAVWKFQCDCGTIVERPAARLAGNARNKPNLVPSCNQPGCSVRFLPGKQAALNRVIGGYVRDAKKRNLAFELTPDFIFHLISQPCHYCGKLPSQLAFPTKHEAGRRTLTDRVLVRNGIDRVNPRLGYTAENVVSCCKQCNRAKSNMSAEEFLQWIQQVYNHNFLEAE